VRIFCFKIREKAVKMCRLISGINLSPNNTYDFVIQLNKEKAFTRTNTDTSKEATFTPKIILDYYYHDKSKIALTDTIPFVLG
jgi:predicted transcriptional regulator